MGFYSPHALLQAATREGIELLPISLNQSNWDHQLERKSANKDYAIRLGFRLVNGLPETAVENIICRGSATGGWDSFEQFTRDCDLARDEITALAASNMFEDFGHSRSDALWKSEAAPFKPMLDDQEPDLDWKPEASLEAIQKDFKAFKTSLANHPVAVIKTEQWSYPVPVDKFIVSNRLIDLPADRDVFVFGMVLVKQSPGSAKGMVFVTLEDETGFFNLAFTPQVYTRFYRQVDQQPFLCVVGQLQRVNESHSILVKRVFEVNLGASLLALDKQDHSAKPEPGIELLKPRAFH